MSAAIFAVCYTTYLSYGVLGAPTQGWQPPSQNDMAAMQEAVAPPWVSAPATRGTFKILYSCTFTLALCVYSAIHLNLPSEENKFTYYRRKSKWVVVAIFAPEIVLYTAWEQWLTVKQITELGQVQSNEFQHITLLDGFYAVMGGYVVDLPDPMFPNTNKSIRSTITPAGIIQLAKKGGFSLASHQTIQDKSKADVLAKILTCFQVSFLVIQSSARKANGYPLTLLEVHTLVHVVCALLMYALWFRKPLSIQDPTVI
ncbi:hypothetical protein BDD12DRAFT_929078, partial [Trichophaea hybrida]